MIQSAIRPTGYRPCACRDCMEIAIGSEGAMCHACQDAGCEGDGECQAPDAYGGEPEPEPSEAETVPPAPAPDPLLPDVVKAMITAARYCRGRITAECERTGFYIVSHGTYDPRLIIPRLVAALMAVSLTAHETLLAPESSLRALPPEALENEQHPYWAGPDAERLVMELSVALNAAAPQGYIFTAEGAWHNMGFFRL